MSKVEDAAVLADEYVLAHSVVFNDKPHETKNYTSLALLTLKLAAVVLVLQFSVQRLLVPARETERICFFCKKSGHVIADCHALSKKQKAAKPVALLASVPRQLPSVENGLSVH